MATQTRTEILSNTGIVACRRNRRTGHLVSVYLANPAGIDAGSCSYAVICEEHATILSQHTKSEAIAAMSDPAAFCEDCQADLAAQLVGPAPKVDPEVCHCESCGLLIDSASKGCPCDRTLEEHGHRSSLAGKLRAVKAILDSCNTELLQLDATNGEIGDMQAIGSRVNTMLAKWR